ncbi:hypothetical protein [Yoonia sp. R2-816]|uniref:hypothetical protein n=1 Tax=Yoonia sp. R2-816 TaxID=3342638 RepID=UPI00372BD13A
MLSFPIRFLLSDRVTASVSRHVGGAAGAAVLAMGLANEVDAAAVGGAVGTLAAFGLAVIKEWVR